MWKSNNIESWLLAYVHDNLKTQEMCEKAVKEDTNILKYVSDQYIMQEMCDKALDCPWLIGHVPDHFKTQEIRALRYAHGQWSIFPIGLWHNNK